MQPVFGKRWVIPAAIIILSVGITIAVLKAYRTPAGAPAALENGETDERRDQAESWTVDPLDAGPLLPRAGRSLFDYLVTDSKNGRKIYDVPFPFEALVKRIGEQIGDEKDRPSLKRVLIPLGRSLQRSAAAPDFFEYPRAVVAIDSDLTASPGQAGLLFKDRLYLGYHEKAELIEVISYNEATGRFEFQVVRDYRAGATPQVFYANRFLCMSCHRNQAPIFSRQLWDETNGNPEIASMLKATGKNFYGFPIEGGVDVPNAIDNAVERANRFAATQLLWSQGCENGSGAADKAIQCRADILTFMLQYRLSGERFFATRAARYRNFTGTFAKGWQNKWPQGLRLPDPGIANRKLDVTRYMHRADPMFNAARLTAGALIEMSNVSYPFDPLNPRDALETWYATENDHRDVDRVVSGLGEFVTSSDIRRIDDHLFSKVSQGAGRRMEYESACEFSSERSDSTRQGSTFRIRFYCGQGGRNDEANELSLQGRFYTRSGKVVDGTIDSLVVNGTPPLQDLEILPAAMAERVDGSSVRLAVAQKLSGLHARLPDGNAIEWLTLSWAAGAAARFSGKVKITILEDFGDAHKAIAEMALRGRAGQSDALSSKPFRRSAVMKELFAQLGLPPISWCCGENEPMPAAVLDPVPKGAKNQNGEENRRGDSAIDKFNSYCAVCHAMNDASPPNFLHGNDSLVEAQLKHCSERIFFRLQMADMAPDKRLKSPMPPLRTPDRRRPDSSRKRDLAILRDYVAGILREESGREPSVDEMIARGYWKLRSCLPENDQPKFARKN